VSAKQAELSTLEARMAEADFWNSPEDARKTIDRSNALKAWTGPWERISARVDELSELAELAVDEADEGLLSEIEEDLASVERQLDELELRNMLRGPEARLDAYLTVHPGAGGTESQDWAEMLMRMYTRWAERRGFVVEVVDLLPGEEAGIKSATLEIRGEYAYGYLVAERGVHRLVRISPYDSQGRRHTSFASVFVYPVVDDDIQIEVDESELRIDTYRASGAGGQHVNKTSSAVRLTHLPTGIVVACQQERSQHKNKAKALKMMRAALYQRALEEKQEERRAIEDSKADIAWGNQIRSYVLQPYTMVKDHRTNTEVGNVEAVLDGRIDTFIESYLRQNGSTSE